MVVGVYEGCCCLTAAAVVAASSRLKKLIGLPYVFIDPLMV